MTGISPARISPHLASKSESKMFKLLNKTNIDFQSKRHSWLALSGVVILAGLISIVFQGLNLGIDFTGGTALTLRAIPTSGSQSLGEESVRQVLEKVGINGAEVKASRAADGEDLLIHFKEKTHSKTLESLIRARLDSLYTAKYTVVADDQLSSEGLDVYREMSYVAIRTTLSKSELENVVQSIGVDKPTVATHLTEQGESVVILAGMGHDPVSRLREALRKEFANYQFEIRSIEVVGPRLGSELRNDAALAIVASWFLIILYLWWRFDLVFGVAAVIALIHDVVITLGIMSILGFEISMTVIAAFLTIIGFSVNDTIVTFDRIRENLRRYNTMDLKELINLSINQTLSRTIITNGTVFIVVTVLLIFGGEVLRAFSFAMFVGSIVGTYSSIYIASPILIDYLNKTGASLSKKMKGKGA